MTDKEEEEVKRKLEVAEEVIAFLWSKGFSEKQILGMLCTTFIHFCSRIEFSVPLFNLVIDQLKQKYPAILESYEHEND